MTQAAAQFISAVIIVSPDIERLCHFYREVLGLPLERGEHGPNIHYECELGEVHFAIHPAEQSTEVRESKTGPRVAFSVTSMKEFVSRLRGHNVELLYPPMTKGFGILAAIYDPDGNLVEFTELSSQWMEYLDSRRATKGDLISQWRSRHGQIDSK